MQDALKDTISIYCKEEKELEYIGTVNKDHIRLLKRQIRFNRDPTLCYNLKYLLYKRGWLKKSIKFKDTKHFIDSVSMNNGLTGIIYNALLSSNVSVSFISTLFISQIDNPLLYEQVYYEIINNKQIINIKNVLCLQINNILKKDYTNDINQLIDVLWDITIAEGGNNVGRGEVCFTLLTDACKANVGDLTISNSAREIEIKGYGGKVGSQFYAETTSQRLANILNMNINQFQLYILKSKENRRIIKERELLKEIINNKVELLYEKVYISEDSNIELIEKRNQLNKKILTSMNNSRVNIWLVKEFLLGKTNIIPKCNGTNVTVQELQVLKKDRHTLETLKPNKKPNKKETKFYFQHAVKGFFIDSYDKLDIPQLIEGFFECRNVKLSSQQQNNLLLAIYNFFLTHSIEDLNNYNSLCKLVLTLHILCYSLTHNFTDIQFINDKTKSAYTLHIPSKEISFAEIFEIIYNDIPEQLKTNLSIGGGQNPSGVSVYLEC